jgi:hypothetical protein
MCFSAISSTSQAELTLLCRHLKKSFAIAGRKVIDTLRAVLPDPEAARTHAIDLATNIGKHTLEPPANAVRVIDEEGSILFRVPIRRSIKLGATIGPHDSLLWLPRPSA